MIPSTDQAKPDGEQGSDLGASEVRGSLRANPGCESTHESLPTRAQGREWGGGVGLTSLCEQVTGTERFGTQVAATGHTDSLV